MLITGAICIQWKFTTPDHRSFSNQDSHFFYHSAVFTFSKVIDVIEFADRHNLISPKLSSQNMRGFDHATILSSSFHSVCKECQAPKSPGEGVLPKKLGGGLQHPSWNPYGYSISNQKLWFSLPYSRPEALEPGTWLERVTSCCSTYMVVGINIKREMVLSPNDEEVADSFKKHTQFKTRVHKP